jgi:CspA family cold shock protein
MGYTGHVKNFNPANGWGFIKCDETEEIYGKDIILLSKHKGETFVNPGDQVSFDIREGAKGPEAVNITVLGSDGFPPPTPEEMVEGMYVGNIKSYDVIKAWGFISCLETSELYGKDIFLRRAKDKGAMVNPGDRVRFTVVDGEKGPEAEQIELLSRDAPGELIVRTPGEYKSEKPKPEKFVKVKDVTLEYDADEARRVKEAVKDGVFKGTIKSFNIARGWGFIQCPDTEETFGKDILLHKKHIGAAQFFEGESVTFSVVDGDKGPEACNVRVHGKARPKAPAAGKGADAGKGAYAYPPMAKGYPWMMDPWMKGGPWGKGAYDAYACYDPYGGWDAWGDVKGKGKGKGGCGKGEYMWACIPVPLVKGKGKGKRPMPYGP